MARPSSYTQEIADAICERVARSESLIAVLESDGMPGYSTVMRWQAENSEFREKLARAREDMADFVSHQILAIADEQSDDWVETKFGPVFNKEAAARSRIRIDARLKMMQMLKPKTYGDKIKAEVTGENGGPLVFKVERAK